MEKEEIERIQEILSSVRPYSDSFSNLKSKVEKISEKSSDMEELESNLVKTISKENDPTIKADYRIFLNELRRR